MTIQKLKKTEEDKFDLAFKYYSLLFTLNNIHLSQRELQLTTYIALKGNLYSGGAKEGFCEKFNTTASTIYNLISPLIDKGILIKTPDKKLLIAPPLSQVNFEDDLTLVIQLTNTSKNQDNVQGRE